MLKKLALTQTAFASERDQYNTNSPEPEVLAQWLYDALKGPSADGAKYWLGKTYPKFAEQFQQITGQPISAAVLAKMPVEKQIATIFQAAKAAGYTKPLIGFRVKNFGGYSISADGTHGNSAGGKNGPSDNG